MKKRVVAGDFGGVVGWMVVGFSVLALACVAGTAFAASKAKKNAACDAEESYKKVVVMSDEEKRPFLGVVMQELDDNLRKGLDVSVKSGVLVTDVIEGSPAGEAGIENGDVIVEFKGRRVDSPSELREMVEDSDVGDTVKVKVIRDKKSKTMTVTLGSHADEGPWSFVTPERFEWFDEGKHAFTDVFGRGRLGVRVTEINDDLGEYFGVKAGEGVLVTDVTDGSPGHKMGIKAGDVIVRVNEEKIGSTADLREAVRELEEGDEFDVDVLRSRADRTLRGEMDEGPARLYSKGLPRKFDVRVPEIDLRRVTDGEMESLKKEMKALKKELEELKDEFKKAKKST